MNDCFSLSEKRSGRPSKFGNNSFITLDSVQSSPISKQSTKLDLSHVLCDESLAIE